MSQESAPSRELEALLSLLAEPSRPRPAGLDGERFVRLAHRHGLAALAAERLRESTAGGAESEALRDGLAPLVGQYARSGLHLLKELLRVLSTLEAEDVRAVPFKGPSLSQRLHGEIALRPYSDVDVIVRRDQVDVALRALATIGYLQKPEGSPRRERHLRQSSYKATLARSPAGPFVDLHWEVSLPGLGLTPPFLDMAHRTTAVRLGGRSVQVLSSEDLFLALVVHGTKHRWQRLLWIHDIATLQRVAELRWDELSAWAERAGMVRMCRLALTLAAELFAAPFPSAFSRPGRDAALELRVDMIRRSHDRASGPWAADRDKARLFLWSLDRQRLRLRRGLDLIVSPTPSDFALVDLPDSLFALYYPVRLLRLAASPLWPKRSSRETTRELET
ncbi:MAG: hypothetical protein DWQ36_18295 [Acidobacteria bacterium]|nr:MAG: hypothetical protein DWQ36_18295 [Acidobacteriota bacterium]